MTSKLLENVISYADKKEMKARGIKLRDKEAVKAYFDEKAKEAEAKRLAEEEQARKEKEENPTTEELLKQIRDILKEK